MQQHIQDVKIGQLITVQTNNYFSIEMFVAKSGEREFEKTENRTK